MARMATPYKKNLAVKTRVCFQLIGFSHSITSGQPDFHQTLVHFRFQRFHQGSQNLFRLVAAETVSCLHGTPSARLLGPVLTHILNQSFTRKKRCRPRRRLMRGLNPRLPQSGPHKMTTASIFNNLTAFNLFFRFKSTFIFFYKDQLTEPSLL